MRWDFSSRVESLHPYFPLHSFSCHCDPFGISSSDHFTPAACFRCIGRARWCSQEDYWLCRIERRRGSYWRSACGWIFKGGLCCRCAGRGAWSSGFWRARSTGERLHWGSSQCGGPCEDKETARLEEQDSHWGWKTSRARLLIGSTIKMVLKYICILPLCRYVTSDPNRMIRSLW